VAKPTAVRRSLVALGLALGLGLVALPRPIAAQNSTAKELEDSRRRLDEIKNERERLERQRERLQGQVHDVSDELDNIERQRESTGRIVGEIERQIGGLSTQLDRSSAELILAQDNLAERRAVLERRLVDIYKRGPLYTFQVLLAAESFGDLLSRYKYLYLTSRQDRALVSDVERLRARVLAQRGQIVSVKDQLDQTKVEREAELDRYGRIAREQEDRLAALRRSARSTERRLSELERDQSRLNTLLASLERSRRDEAARSPRAGAAPAAATPGSITTSDIGKLDWPVEGRIVYRFGRDTLPSGGVIRWNGIGIAAAVGTPIRAVESGRVRLVGQFGTYGLTVVLEHGNGYYSIYSHLNAAAVKLGAAVTRGETIGTVGGQNSDYGPHLHFEIRGENQIALDPTDWLRRR
jgi:septal ring factor EnvC (AmiA/AmiB activator)